HDPSSALRAVCRPGGHGQLVLLSPVVVGNIREDLLLSHLCLIYLLYDRGSLLPGGSAAVRNDDHLMDAAGEHVKVLLQVFPYIFQDIPIQDSRGSEIPDTVAEDVHASPQLLRSFLQRARLLPAPCKNGVKGGEPLRKELLCIGTGLTVYFLPGNPPPRQMFVSDKH